MTAHRTYLDYNASAPLRPEARAAVVAALEVCGNPSSVHAEGRLARRIVDEAREHVARLVNARPSEVVFTSGATEANAWAMSAGWDWIALAGIEHDSVRAPAEVSGAEIVELATDADGVADAHSFDAPSWAHETARRGVLTLQLANNETGVVQRSAEAGVQARASGAAFHTDAVQACGRMAVDFATLGADTMSLSSHKIGGPKGAGALVIRSGVELAPLIAGGGQERRRRGGTENVAAIAGFGAAAKAAAGEVAHQGRIAALRNYLEERAQHLVPEAVVIGKGAPRLPNTSCIAWPGKLAETLVIKLDLAGVAVSAGAACSSGKVGESSVLKAMGIPSHIARSAIRVSLGAGTTEKDIESFLAAWEAIRGGTEIAA